MDRAAQIPPGSTGSPCAGGSYGGFVPRMVRPDLRRRGHLPADLRLPPYRAVHSQAGIRQGIGTGQVLGSPVQAAAAARGRDVAAHASRRILVPSGNGLELHVRPDVGFAFYYQNWFLAAEAVDYYAADHSTASPLQHFWSLSIQGQIFILWPLIFAAAALISRAARLRIRALLIYMFGAVFTVSLVFSIITTHSNQTFAYFDTRARLWEFALGSLLALVLPYLNFSRPVRVILGWLGVVGMLSCGIILQVGTQFPGYMALWPTLSAAFIIVAGFTGSNFGADRFLSWKPLVKLGDISYALYLFHWPLLVFFLVWSKRSEAGPKSGAAIILVSIVGAYFATKFIDTPLRRNKWLERKRSRAVLAIVVCVATAAVPLGAWQIPLKVEEMRVAAQLEAAQAEMTRNYPGALALQDGYVNAADPGIYVIEQAMGIVWKTLRRDLELECRGPEKGLFTDRTRRDPRQDHRCGG